MLQDTLDGSPAVGGYQQCLRIPGAAVLNPIKYINGLAEAVVAKGGQIYEQTRVRKPDTSEVTTMAGNKVCRAVYTWCMLGTKDPTCVLRCTCSKGVVSRPEFAKMRMLSLSAHGFIIGWHSPMDTNLLQHALMHKEIESEGN